MFHDGDSRRGLVGQLRHVGALHSYFGVCECVEIAGGKRARRLDPDGHPGVFDHREHLRDAVVHVADEVADRRYAVSAEGQFARGEDLKPILCSKPVAKTPLRGPSSSVSGSNRYFGT